ncbi:MAG: hypothetical protein KDC53_24850, partial [Saprospiraceae bacterium]|nr:hypothetical protein [Saprospiraceae bacterium]
MVKNKILLKNGKSVLPDRVFVGDLSIEDGVITHIRSDISESGFDKVYNLEGKYILPGFIDIHNHGSAGFDFSFGQYYTERDAFELEDDSYFPGLQNALQFYARRGTTKVLLTSMAAPLEKLEYSFSKLNEYQRNEMPFAELVGGINLEGTFLKDPHYAGAQNPKFFYDTDPSIIDRLQEASGNLLKIVNVPPEHGKQGLDLITSLRENNIVVAGGHTAA